jgi:hypothetical protein
MSDCVYYAVLHVIVSTFILDDYDYVYRFMEGTIKLINEKACQSIFST